MLRRRHIIKPPPAVEQSHLIEPANAKPERLLSIALLVDYPKFGWCPILPQIFTTLATARQARDRCRYVGADEFYTVMLPVRLFDFDAGDFVDGDAEHRVLSISEYHQWWRDCYDR